MSTIENKINELKEKANKIGAELIIDKNRFHENKRHVLWYGGEIARIKYKNAFLIISAIGDVIVHLEAVPKTHNEILHTTATIYDEVKDTNNSGQFYEIMSEYIKDDTGLEHLLKTGTISLPTENPISGIVYEQPYELIVTNNNWWEVSAVRNNQFYDLQWCCESDYWDDAIKEAIDGIEQEIKNI